MFPNLNAEQARNGYTNLDMAKKLGISRASFEIKKRNGNFSLSQVKTLLKLFNSDFEYLFCLPSNRKEDL